MHLEWGDLGCKERILLISKYKVCIKKELDEDV